MFFYIGQIGNPTTGFSDIREFLKSDAEKKTFLLHKKTSRNKIYNLRRAKTLAQLLYEASRGYTSRDKLKSTTIKNYQKLINRFGEELMCKEFPNELVNEKLFLEIGKLNIYQEDTTDDKPDYRHKERGQDINQ